MLFLYIAGVSADSSQRLGNVPQPVVKGAVTGVFGLDRSEPRGFVNNDVVSGNMVNGIPGLNRVRVISIHSGPRKLGECTKTGASSWLQYLLPYLT